MSPLPIDETIQELIDARTAALNQGFSDRDVDQIFRWFSRDIRWDDVIFNKYDMPYDELKEFFSSQFSQMDEMKVEWSKTTGQSPEFTTWEWQLKIVYNQNAPALGMEASEPKTIKGVGLQWWRMEDDGVWRITRERDYVVAG
jgi:hypothetical protein